MPSIERGAYGKSGQICRLRIRNDRSTADHSKYLNFGFGWVSPQMLPVAMFYARYLIVSALQFWISQVDKIFT
jgi:hypothetical protein